jgi:hypothetical protein
MRQVISAPPTIDVSTLAANIAGLAPVDADPTRSLVERYGYQTLYEIPRDFQKKIRLELIDSHTKRLRESPHAVLDHSVFAYLADWMRWLWSDTHAEEWEMVLKRATPAVELSEAIHHVVSGPAADYDGFRWLDQDHARQLERLMRSLYRDFRCEGRVKEVTF